jgi:hypothetical protein
MISSYDHLHGDEDEHEAEWLEYKEARFNEREDKGGQEDE